MENREKIVFLLFLFLAAAFYLFPGLVQKLGNTIYSNNISSSKQSSQVGSNLFLEDVQKNVNATKYNIDYSFQTTTFYGSFNITGNGTENISRNGMKISSDSETTVLSEKSTTKSYSIPEGNFSCTSNETQNNFICQRINQSQSSIL